MPYRLTYDGSDYDLVEDLTIGEVLGPEEQFGKDFQEWTSTRVGAAKVYCTLRRNNVMVSWADVVNGPDDMSVTRVGEEPVQDPQRAEEAPPETADLSSGPVG